MPPKTAPAPPSGAGDPSTATTDIVQVPNSASLPKTFEDELYNQKLAMATMTTLHPSYLHLSSDDVTFVEDGEEDGEEDGIVVVRRRRRRVLVVIGILLVAILLSVVVALSVNVARRRGNPSAATESTTAGAPTKPDMMSESYVQTYYSGDMKAMNSEIQVDMFEKILAGYAVYYLAEREAGAVTTQCVLNFQRLSSGGRRRKHRSGGSGNVFGGGGGGNENADGPSRRLLRSAGDGGSSADPGRALEVDFTVTWSSSPSSSSSSSSSSSVNLAQYPADFMAYMNSQFGRDRTLLDIRTLLGLTAESEEGREGGGGSPVLTASDVATRGADGQPQVFVVTDEPTPAPTTAPTSAPTSAPTFPPTANPTDRPTSEPTNDPTAEPTYKPTAKPTYPPTKETTSQCCWLSVFDWCMFQC